MTITLNVPQPIATRLQQNDDDRRRAERLIVAAFDETPETVSPAEKSDDWLTRFQEAHKTLTPITTAHGAAPLSDYAVSRESMYNEHERHL